MNPPGSAVFGAVPGAWLGRLRAWILPILIVLLGCTVLSMLTRNALRSERERIDNVLALRADWRAANFESRLEEAFLPLQSLADLVAVAGDDRPGVFDAFARTRLGRLALPPSSAMWIPRVERGERELHETIARRDTSPDYQIRDDSGRAPDRTVYYPILLHVRFTGQPPRFGIDLGALPDRRAVIERARDEGQPVATAPIRLLGQPADGPDRGIIVFQPAYRGGAIDPTVEGRRRDFLGVVTAVYPLDALLQGATVGTPAILGLIQFAVNDGTDRFGPPFFQLAPEPNGGGVSVAPPDQSGPAGIALRRTIVVAGGRWDLNFLFPDELIAAQRTFEPLLPMVGGLGMAALVVMMIFQYRAQARRLETIAAARGVALDVADRHASQLSRRMEALVRASPLAIVTLDEAGRVLTWNPAAERLSGLDASKVVGHEPPASLFAPTEVFAAMMNRLRDGEDVANSYLTGHNAKGHEVELLVSAAPIPSDRRPDAAAAVLVLLDDTERKRLELQLRQAQKMEAVGQLTGGLAHDFNNILGAIIGNLDLMAMRLGNQANVRRHLEAATNAAMRGAELTGSLLAFSRRQPLRPQVVDVNAVVTSMDRLVGRSLGEATRPSVHLTHGLPAVEVDPAQLQSAILNLCVNARDAMPDGGTLLIETSTAHLDEAYSKNNHEVEPGDYVVVTVSDTGTGMTPDVLQHVFEPFFTTKEVGKGSGLGLSMVYGFMKQSGGHVKIYSEPGRGTTVRLYMRSTTKPAPAAASEQQLDLANGKGETVLVVEDNDAVRKVVVAQIRTLGYRVLEADSGPAALELLRVKQPVDLLFTDIVMPGGMDGRALIREALKLRPGLKAILTSGFTDLTVRAMSDDVSAPLMSKPYRIGELASRLRSVLDSTE